MSDEGAEQCGFCNPGFIMNIFAMEQELEDPTEEDIKSICLVIYADVLVLLGRQEVF